MRVVEHQQMVLGEMNIADIKFNPKSRDDIPQILKGLQHIYLDATLREAVFTLLETKIAPEVSKKTGRPGLELWKIFVLGVLRLDLNVDYDRIHDLANSHREIRQMLGHSGWSDGFDYELQTIKDNVKLLTPELLDEINQVVVKAGHQVVKKKETKCCVGGAIPLWLRRMFIFRRIFIYCLMRCAR